jgi:hypothetical protein
MSRAKMNTEWSRCDNMPQVSDSGDVVASMLLSIPTAGGRKRSMPTWDENIPIYQRVLTERLQAHPTRKDLYLDLEKELGRPVVTFFTSFSHDVIIGDRGARWPDQENQARVVRVSGGY